MCFEWLLGSGGVSWGPWVGGPPRGVEDGVGGHRKIGLCADFEDVQLDPNQVVLIIINLFT